MGKCLLELYQRLGYMRNSDMIFLVMLKCEHSPVPVPLNYIPVGMWHSRFTVSSSSS